MSQDAWTTSPSPNMSEVEVESSKLNLILRIIAWGLFMLLFLVFFTLLKIPDARVTGTITGFINQQLAHNGIQFSADDGHISLGLGLSYEMTGVKLHHSVKNKTLKISRIAIHPSLLAVLLGKISADFELEEGPGKLKGSYSQKEQDFELAFESTGLNLGRMGALPLLAGIEGTAEIKGEGRLTGNLQSFSSMAGDIKLNLGKVTLDEQSIMGFKIPKISIADGVVDLAVTSGKVNFQTLRLGRVGSTDDLFGTLTGDMKLGRSMDTSDVNFRIKIGISQNLNQAMPLLDATLNSFGSKKPDGTYGIRISGPMYGAVPSKDEG